MVTMHVQKASTSNVCLGCSIEDGRASSGIRFEVFEAVSGLYVPVTPHCLLPNFHFHYTLYTDFHGNKCSHSSLPLTSTHFNIISFAGIYEIPVVRPRTRMVFSGLSYPYVRAEIRLAILKRKVTIDFTSLCLTQLMINC